MLLLTSCLLAGAPRVARADDASPRATAPPALTDAARALWYRGVNAFRAGDYEKAREAFEQCYQLMPKTDVLRNLSISELESGHYVSGARHLAQLLATPGALNPSARTEAEKRLTQTEARIGRVSVRVDVEGAEVLVDNAPIGKSPLTSSWYVEPGQHVIGVRKQGYPSESRQIFALAGVDIPVEVSLEKLRQEKAAGGAATQPGPAAQAADTTTRRGSSSTQDIIVLAATGTVAVVGLATGIAFNRLAADDRDEADALEAGLKGKSGSENICAEGTPVNDDCTRYQDLRSDAITERRWSTAGFIGCGVGAAATIGYALWMGFRGNSPVQASFDIGNKGAGIGVRGAF